MGFPCDDGLHLPRVEIASMYLDQVNATDTGVATAEEHGVPIFPSILRALTLGRKELAVDGVLIIGEHGDYPLNEKGQKLYPRRHFLEQVAGVLSTAGGSVSVFSDKHLSYNWTDALWMYDRMAQLEAPFMAGSSLPVCWRRPALEYALETSIEAALVIGYGPIESYGFHALETLQCVVERRQGGECGVGAVQCLAEDAVWEWLATEPVHVELARRAAQAMRQTTGPWGQAPSRATDPAAFLIEYRDGLEAAVLMLNGYSSSFALAGSADGQVQACEFVLQSDHHCHFSYLGLNVEEMFVTGRPSYPVERTLLTTGILAAAMDSRYLGGLRLETPHLDVRYRAVAAAPYRPTGSEPSGATLDPWPPRTAE